MIAALALTGLAMAAPPAKIGTTKADTSFTVRQATNPGFVRNGPMQLAKAYRKYGKPLPADLAAAVANITAASLDKRTSGSVVATPQQYDSEYLCPVQIGTPAQTLNLDFDTGSADLWVFSSELSSSNRGSHAYYTASKSSTSKKKSGYTWSISYGDGSSASGDVYTDVVSIGGVKVTGQAVETASKISSEFVSDAADGLVGLAFSSINTVSPTSQNTWFDNAKSSLNSGLFAANLKYEAAGAYDFGALKSASYKGSIAYTSVDSSQGFWSFTASGFSVGGDSSSSTSLTGIADTGTTLLLLDDSVVSAYYNAISGASYDSSQGGYTFDCSITPPDFAFTVGSNTITIPGQYMNYAPASGSNCFGGIQSDSGIGFAIFGDIALKAAYVVFDESNLRLGWASKSL